MDLFALKPFFLFLSFIASFAGAGAEILPVGPVDGRLGKNVTIETLFKGPSYVTMTWTFNKDGTATNIATGLIGVVSVEEAYKSKVVVNATTGALTVMSLAATDSGDYGLTIVGQDEAKKVFTKTGEIKLRVLEPVSDVTVKSDLTEAFEHNSSVVLTCTAKGSFLKFTWSRSDKPIAIDGIRLSVVQTETSSKLTIRDVLRSDLDGHITCSAQNKLETEKSAPFKLTVYYGPEKVSISPAIPPKALKSGANFTLTCTATSNPPATYTWYNNKKKIEYMGPVITLAVIEKLGLGKVAADYMCHAANAKTLRTMPSPSVNFAVMEEITGIAITGPAAKLIAGNSTANLSCQATAGTIVTRKWFKAGKALVAGERVAVAPDQSSILISTLTKEDNAEYMCELSNPLNTLKATYKMVVNYGPVEVKVEHTSGDLEPEQKVVLTCSCDSLPAASYTWKFNTTLTEIKTAEYVIEKAVYKNSGTYMCEAFNSVTGKTVSASQTISIREDDGLSSGAIAGIVIGVLAALAIAIGIILYCRQKVPVESPY